MSARGPYTGSYSAAVAFRREPPFGVCAGGAADLAERSIAETIVVLARIDESGEAVSEQLVDPIHLVVLQPNLPRAVRSFLKGGRASHLHHFTVQLADLQLERSYRPIDEDVAALADLDTQEPSR